VFNCPITVRTITLNIFCSLDSTNNSRVFLFSVFLTLENTRVHIYASNCGNVVANIEATIDKPFSINTTLWILYIKPDDGHVWLQRYLDNSGIQCNWYVVKDVITSDNVFNNIWSNRSTWILYEIWKTNNFEI